MEFLIIDDFNGIIGSNTLATLRGTNDANLIQAEKLAIAELDPLRNNFDIDGELAKTDTDRNDRLVLMIVHITIYYLYNKIEDVDIPERVDNNYNKQVKDIEKIATGKLSTTLTPLLDDDSLPKSNYRFGGDDERDNDIF